MPVWVPVCVLQVHVQNSVYRQDFVLYEYFYYYDYYYTCIVITLSVLLLFHFALFYFSFFLFIYFLVCFVFVVAFLSTFSLALPQQSGTQF